MKQEYLHEVLTYDKNTGTFCWNARPLNHFKSAQFQNAWNARFAGKSTGHTDGRGYIQIKIDGRKYLAHRLAYFYVYGVLPAAVDHFNGNKQDNRIENLRKCTKSQNAANRQGLKPSAYKRKSGKWSTQICKDYKIYCLGTFDTKQKAQLAYKQKHIELFGEFSPFL